MREDSPTPFSRLFPPGGSDCWSQTQPKMNDAPMQEQRRKAHPQCQCTRPALFPSLRPSTYFRGCLRRCPYKSSSANSTHLYSITFAFFSKRRYRGMLIFQGRVNTLGSSIVASYIKTSGLMRVYRSTTCKASLWKFPALSNQVWSLRSVTSTTSVSPSQRPRDHPIQESVGLFVCPVMRMVRVALANSYAIRILSGVWII